MLKKHPSFPGIRGPVVTVVMDGIGMNPRREGNAVFHARTPVLDRLLSHHPHTVLKAHGRFGLDRALQPAIRYAETGFPV